MGFLFIPEIVFNEPEVEEREKSEKCLFCNKKNWLSQ